jgi:ABC-2 type transport system permease protein
MTATAEHEPTELREVTGPSALGGGWRRALDLLLVMSTTDFKRTYFGTALGYVWSIARPLLLFAVLLEVFTKIAKLGVGVQDYPQLLLLNIVLFGFFQDGAGIAVPSVVVHESIVRKTQFPRLVIPVSVVLTALINLTLNLLVALAFVLAAGVTPRWTWLLLPLVLVPLLTVITTAAAMILSSLYPRFRDLGIIWTVFSTALFYGTPVIYTLGGTRVSQHLQSIVALNPLAPIFELARRWIIDPRAPTPAAITGGGVRLLVPLAIYLAICAAAVWIFNREAPRVAEAL